MVLSKFKAASSIHFIEFDRQTRIGHCASSAAVIAIDFLTYYRSTSDLNVPYEVSFRNGRKYTGKFLVWQGICQDVKALRAYIFQGTMNGKIYEKSTSKAPVSPENHAHSQK